ncbi:MAG: GAF domain-containing protein, partial [Nocardioidaceae bacterium]
MLPHPQPVTPTSDDADAESTLQEAARLAAVYRYDILDTPADGAFDQLAALAAELIDVPIAIVSIVDEDRIWFKAHHGLDVSEIPRDPGLCASAILNDDTWVVENATTDPRTLANPLVAGEFGLRFYVGHPLITHDGHNLGTLCVIDHEPREVTEHQTRILRGLAQLVVEQLELRLNARRAVTSAENRL